MRHSAFFSSAILLVILLSCREAALTQTPTIPRARLLTLPGEATRPHRVSITPGTALGTTLSEASEIERRAFESVNLARSRNGLQPLIWDASLCQMARTHSESMGRRGYFAHETPEGLGLRERVRAVGIAHFRVLAENIAYNQGEDDSGGFAVERWLISPGHRANVLSNEFEQSAVGSFVAADGSVYLTQVFIKR